MNEMYELLEDNKEDFKLKIDDRIKAGELIVSWEVSTKEDQINWWEDFITWDSVNENLLRSSFNIQENTHYSSYKRSSFFGISNINDKRKFSPSLEESIENERIEIRDQLVKLKRFREIIDFLKSKGSLKSSTNNKLEELIKILTKFHRFSQELRDRRKDREVVVINDEYDVQYLINAILHLHFDDVRPEEYSPSNSGGNSRIDFLLKKEDIILEIKMSNEKLGAKELGKELLVDIGRYKEYPGFNTLLVFIYDKGDYIRNKNGLICDLENQSSEKLKVKVIINPN